MPDNEGIMQNSAYHILHIRDPHLTRARDDHGWLPFSLAAMLVVASMHGCQHGRMLYC